MGAGLPGRSFGLFRTCMALTPSDYCERVNEFCVCHLAMSRLGPDGGGPWWAVARPAYVIFELIHSYKLAGGTIRARVIKC
jgi:hypothetical protein